ncbi:MAG: RHS repeat-associated core domain-containing protein [Bryobacteraceae bacterium]
MDSTGAEYRLDQNSGNVWSSKESIYVWFDANSNTLYFRDGTSWYFGCVSGPGEADSGVMYPTKFKDINLQNEITISYQQGSGASWANSSGRIEKIKDARAPAAPNDWTYQIIYSNGHYYYVNNNIGSGEQFQIWFSQNQPLSDPFSGGAYNPTWFVSQISVISGNYSFITNGSGEITRITMPKGGYLGYDYTTTTYSTGRKYREVSQRYLSKNGSTQTAYAFSHEPSPGADVHDYTVLNDPGGVGQKKWTFSTSGFSMGLVTQYQGNQLPGPVTKTQSDFTWAQNGSNNSYIASTITTMDPGANQVQSKTAQTVDTYGNVTQVQSFAFGNLTTAARRNDYTYSTNSGLINAYIRNRMTSASIIDVPNSVTINLVTNTWGTDTSYPGQWGRLLTSVSAAGTRNIGYDSYGNPTTSNVNGVSSSVTFDASRNFVPTALTVGSVTENLAYNSFFGIFSTTGANGDQTQVNYYNAQQVSSVNTSLGATPLFTYGTTTTTATVNSRWTRTTTDGLGRTILTEVGTGATTTTPVSITETEYDSCGCSPLGKLKRTSLPHASGASALWTTYTYDGIGRTLSVQAPDGASSTTYSYLGNTVTVTDAAGKWKKYSSDAFGHLVQVNEPNPAGGADYVTSYTYDILDHLIGVSMPRASGTQTRTFNYGTPPTPLLQSATNPESGTVSYTYDSNKRLSTVTDAKGQKKVMTYDSVGRVTQIARYYNSTTEDTQQRTTFYYDTNPIDAAYSTNITGRLAAVEYYGGKCTSLGPPRTGCDLIQESYKYNSSGKMLGKRVKLTRGSASGTLTASFTYDNEGRPTQVQYPSWTCSGCSQVVGSKYNFGYDTMGRLNTMTDGYTSASLISGVTYGVANEILSMSGILNETRQYSSTFQLTRITVPSVLDIQYAYPSAGSNNGKLASQTDVLSGEQVVYTYDSLNRLATAQTVDNPSVTQWGQSYNYDGFGNLTDQNVIKGSAPTMHVVYNASTNRQTGDTADANGNIGSGYLYDIENRLLRPGASSTVQYGYDAGNKRVWRGDTGVDEFAFFAGSQKLATYTLAVSGTSVRHQLTSTNVYFGGRMIGKGTYNSGGTNDKVTVASVAQDRLGSMNGKFYPYGQERPSATSNDKEKFTGYYRDASTGLDYADQRYHQAGVGRFMTPDPFGGSAKPSDPGSWNRYGYVIGDPVNHSDPSGLCDVVVGGIKEQPGSDTGTAEFAQSIGAMLAYPFDDTNSVFTGVAEVIGSAIGQNSAAIAAAAAIHQAALDSDGPINIYAFSGGAQAFKDALSILPAADKERIQSITYASPGVVGSVATVNGITPAVVTGSGAVDAAAMIGTQFSQDVFHGHYDPITTECEHQAGCEFAAATLPEGSACRNPNTYTTQNGYFGLHGESPVIEGAGFFFSTDWSFLSFYYPDPSYADYYYRYPNSSANVFSCWTDGQGGTHCF